MTIRVPYLSEETIERDAQSLLAEYAYARGVSLNPPIPGEFEWNGHLYQGRHEPLASRELWERVQGVLDGRRAKKYRRAKHDFAFSGLIACGHCGCSMVAEIQKAAICLLPLHRLQGEMRRALRP